MGPEGEYNNIYWLPDGCFCSKTKIIACCWSSSSGALHYAVLSIACGICIPTLSSPFYFCCWFQLQCLHFIWSPAFRRCIQKFRCSFSHWKYHFFPSVELSSMPRYLQDLTTPLNLFLSQPPLPFPFPNWTTLFLVMALCLSLFLLLVFKEPLHLKILDSWIEPMMGTSTVMHSVSNLMYFKTRNSMI